MTGAQPAAVPLPMFPLSTVLFPHMVLPLHVFEPRYRALATDCLGSDRQLGVVLIERGAEVGGGDSRFGVGTVATIASAARYADGRWGLLCVSTRRISVASWLPEDPYPLAVVQDRPEGPLPAAALELVAAAEGHVRRALALAAELDEASAPATVRFDTDPAVAAWQLAATAPLGPADKQRLLEEDDPLARVSLLTELVSDAAAVLAYRLSGG